MNELEEFFSNFDSKITKLQQNIIEQSIQAENNISMYILTKKQVELNLNESRHILLSKCNKLFMFHFKIVKNNLFKQLKTLKLTNSEDYNDFKLILFKLKCILFDYGLLSSCQTEILTQSSLINDFFNESNQCILTNLSKFLEKTFSNLKFTFKTSNLNLNVTYIGDILFKNDFINTGKCKYFHLFNAYADERLANETLALDNYLSYKTLPITLHQLLVYPKSFKQGCKLQILDSKNGNELFIHTKSLQVQLVPYHFILTEKCLIAIFYNSDDSCYELDVYDHRLILFKSKIFTSLINEIEFSQTYIKVKSMNHNQVVDEITVDLKNEMTVSNNHLKNRILFSYNNTYQGYIIKIKVTNNNYEKVISSHLQASNKTIVLVHNDDNDDEILLEFTSYDKKYYNLI